MAKYIEQLVYVSLTLAIASLQPAYSKVSMEPSGVARLSFATGGSISFLAAGEKKWVRAAINRPLVIGDRVWTGNSSYLELQLANATVRMGNQTSLKILNIDKRLTQIQLSTGTIIVKVRNLQPQQRIEISTINLAFSITKPGTYRVVVNEKAQITFIGVMNGLGKVYGTKVAYQINQGEYCPFGPNLKLYRCTSLPAPDRFARWSSERDRFSTGAKKYISVEMIGYEDLEQHGKWKSTKKYGNIWTPAAVTSNWAPYRSGKWVWIRHWGWTWVDDKPWGFAPFHYGRWVYLESQWSWVPGPRTQQPVYAPALVVFVGGGRDYNLRLPNGPSGIAWFPLAPGEVYLPPRNFSQQYFINVNNSNTFINNQNLNNFYNNRNLNIKYQNLQIPNGITAVPNETFLRSQPVNRALVNLPLETINQAPKNPVAPIVPDTTSLLGGNEAAQSQPPTDLVNQPSVVTTPPPPASTPFSEEQKQLQENPGHPLPAQENEQKPVQGEDSNINVVDPAKAAEPISKEQMEQAPLLDPSLIPAQIDKPADESLKPADPTKPDESGKPAPIQPDESVKPAEPTKPDESIKPAEPTQPDESLKPAEPTKPVESLKPAEPTNPDESIKPAEPTQPDESVKPAEPTQPNDIIKPEPQPETQPQTEIQQPSETQIQPETQPQPEVQQVPANQLQAEPQPQPEAQQLPATQPQSEIQQPQSGISPQPEMQPQPGIQQLDVQQQPTIQQPAAQPQPAIEQQPAIQQPIDQQPNIQQAPTVQPNSGAPQQP